MADSDTDNPPNPDDAEAQAPAQASTRDAPAEETPSPDAQASAPESTEAEAPPPESAESEAPAPESAPSEAPAPEAAAEAEEAAAAAPNAEAPAEAAAEAEAAEPAGTGGVAAGGAGTAEAQFTSKERRRRARSTHTGAPRPSRTPQERHAERLSERREKAVRRRARRLQERAKAAARAKGRERQAATDSEALAPVHAPVEGKRRERQGVVVSDKAEKTITVRIDVARPHRRYGKIVRSSSTLHAHDENNEAHEGDVVRVVESRPLSRTKHWTLIDVLERAR
jgi:small subunit ribosomal protein S17